MHSRRAFLQTGIGASLIALASGTSRAAGNSRARPRNLIIALAYGGWDTMWVFDPKPDHTEIDRIPGRIRNFGDLPIWVDDSRSAVTSFFEHWGSLATVINGISVQSLAHESCVDIVLTGALGQNRADLGARLAERHGISLPLPYLSLSPQIENRGFESHTGMLGDSNQLMSLATPQLNYPRPGQTQPDLGLELNQQEHELVLEYLAGQTQRLQARYVGFANKRGQLEDYMAAMNHAAQLQERAHGGGMLSDPTLFVDYDGGWRHVPAAFADDLSRCAMIQPQLYWDTHAYNEEQGTAYQDFFSGLDLMMDELHKAKVLEHTDVLVLSEMGRTPMHNVEGGKDHWPWTSAMLLSTQTRGQRVLGQTDALLRPIPIDLETGAPDPDGSMIHAEQVLAAVAELHGVPAKEWYEREPFYALFA